MSNQKYDINLIKEYMSKENYTCISTEYINCFEKLEIQCPNNHIFKMNWNTYKNNNQRCSICYGNLKYDYTYIKQYIESFNGYKLLSDEYKGNKVKLKIECPEKHIFFCNFNNFKSKNSRCPKCSLNNLSKKFRGSGNPMWNNNRTSILLNQRLRERFSKNWIIENMKDDSNYENFLEYPTEYQIDHIFPVYAFIQYMNENSMNEMQIKDLINKKENLQLLQKNINFRKGRKFNKNEFYNYINKNLY